MANINSNTQNVAPIDPMTKVVEEAKALALNVQSTITTTETPEQELARLRQENAQLKAGSANVGRVTAKLSNKGGMSVYGLGRFPVTLYRSQWEAFFGAYDVIKAFFEANKAAMIIKPTKEDTKA